MVNNNNSDWKTSYKNVLVQTIKDIVLIKIYIANYNSVRNKLDYLELLLSSNSYSIVCLVEWFLNFTDIDNLSLYNTSIFRCDQDIHAGGVVIICKSILIPLRFYYNIHNSIEYICLNIYTNSQIRLTCIYCSSTTIELHIIICDLITNIQQLLWFPFSIIY